MGKIKAKRRGQGTTRYRKIRPMKTKTTRTKKRINSNKKKPIMIQSEVTPKTKPTITINILGGCIEDVVKEKCNEVNVIIHDYDIEGLDEDAMNSLCTDQYGKQYQVITF
jgi:hypothetical protein